MTTPIPLDTFSSELAPSESVEWTGQPNLSVIFHREDWLAIPFSLMFGGFTIAWFWAAAGVLLKGQLNRDFAYFGILWGAPFVIIGQYLIWGRFVYDRWVKRRTFYALTKRRALIVRRGLLGRTALSADFANLALIERRTRRDGIGSISFGGPVTGTWRWGKNLPPRPPTFDDIDNAESVYQLVLRLQDQRR